MVGAAWFVYANSTKQELPQTQPSPSQNTDKECKEINGKQICPEDYIGLEEKEAISKAQANGLAYRVVARDDEEIAITMDLRPDRINFSIQNGKVYKVEFY